MITDFFINLLISIANILPSAPSGLTNSFAALTNVFNIINYYAPITEIFIAIGIYITVINWRIIFGAIKWVLERFVI